MSNIEKFWRMGRRRRGLALVLVTCVMALAAVLGYALLSASSVQANISANGLAAAIADAQAESGVHLAMYYLLNPGNAPKGSTSYWQGASNITFASSATGASPIAGSVSVTVTNPSKNVYQVTSVGSSAGASIGGGVVQRTIVATVEVTTSYQINQAGTFNSNLTVSSGVTLSGSPDAVLSGGKVTMSGGTIDGNVEVDSGNFVTGSGTFLGSVVVPSTPPSTPAPTLSDLHDYSQYTYNGVVYNATSLNSTSTLSNETLGPTASNPLGVYVYTYTGSNSSTLTMNSGVTIDGTLQVHKAKLTVQGNNNTITPISYTPQNSSSSQMMPGLLIDQQLQVSGLLRSLTVNGVVFADGGIVGQSLTTGSKLTINGALLLDGAGVSSYSGTLGVTFNAVNANVPDLSSANQVPTGVKLLSYSPPS